MPQTLYQILEKDLVLELVVNVVDCVYSLPKTQVGWVNGNPYYGKLSTFTQLQDVRWFRLEHVSTPHTDTIYNTKEESLGKAAPITYTPSTTTDPQIQQTDVSEPTDASTPNTSDTAPTTTTPQTTTTPTQTTQPTTPQQQTPPPTPPSTPPPSTPPSGGGGSGGSGGGSLGGGY